MHILLLQLHRYLMSFIPLFLHLLVITFQFTDNTYIIAKTIECKETEYDFKIFLKKDLPLSHTFSIKNISLSEFIIENICTTCSCISVKCDRKVVKSGESANITLSFNDEHEDGDFCKSAIVYVSTLNRPFVLRIKGKRGNY